MYPEDHRSESSPRAPKSFGDGFLGAMDDEFESFEDEEESGLPLIEEEILAAGKYQDVVLEEASLDEPSPGMERVYILEEEDWDYATADFHGSYEAPTDAVQSSSSAVDSFEPEPARLDDEALAILGSLSGGFEEPNPTEQLDDGFIDRIDAERNFEGSDPVSSEPSFDNAFEDVEEQDDDLDIESILAGIERPVGESDEEKVEVAPRVKIESNFRVSEEDAELMQGFDVDEIISFGIGMGASDIHIHPEKKLGFRVRGSIVKSGRFDPIPTEILRRIQQKIVTNVADRTFLENWELDTSYTVRSGPYRGRRVRLSVVKSFEEPVLTMRIVPQDIPQPKELEIEDELMEWSELPNGLILMNGPTGTGKSTTLASLVQSIQMRLDGVIVTIEKPVEYMYKDQGLAMVTQREVGRDTRSFAAALDSTMRMDPDVILIGETRNAVEMDAALYAADTGHLTLSTTHANSAADTLSRIKKMYSGDDQRQALESLSAVSRGFAAQVLCKTADGKGRFAVREILTVDRSIADLIREGDNRAIRRFQEDRGITLDHGLVRAAKSGRCTVAEARTKSVNRAYFDALMENGPRSF